MDKRGYQATAGRGGHGVSIVGTFDQNSPRFITAQQACQKLLPSGAGSASTVFQRKQHYLAVAECMRKHGYPSFPNPNSQGQLLIGPNEGFDANSPQFTKAMQTCGGG
jgi:hypothetical protein